MSLKVYPKTEQARGWISEAASKYISATIHAPPWWWTRDEDGRKCLYVAGQMSQSFIDFLLDKAGEEFFDHFDVRGSVEDNYGDFTPVGEYVKKALGVRA